MAKRNPPKRLFKADRVSSYQHDRSPISRMKQMSRAHEDILQNIEATLVAEWREDPDIDDRSALEALQASVSGAGAEDARVSGLVAALRSIREFRAEVGDATWLEAVRVVADSVRRHSKREPGETSYLEFVAPYVG